MNLQPVLEDIFCFSGALAYYRRVRVCYIEAIFCCSRALAYCRKVRASFNGLVIMEPYYVVVEKKSIVEESRPVLMYMQPDIVNPYSVLMEL